MRKQYVAIGACAASFAMLVSPALAQNNSGTPETYQAARAAGAASQKVAPPNLVLPADMGGGTYSQRSMNSNADNPNGSSSTSGSSLPTTGTPNATPPTNNPSNPSSPQSGPANNGNNTASPNTKPGG